MANNNLAIGGQSGSDRILESSHRGHSVQAVVSAVRFSLEAGFLPDVDLVFGLPGETPSDVEASLRLAQRLTAMGARIHGHTFMPLPGTPYRNEAAGHLEPKTQHVLAGLAARGKLHGQWRQQITVAENLARLRRRP